MIWNLAVPDDGDETNAVKEVLDQLDVEYFDPSEHILNVERKEMAS